MIVGESKCFGKAKVFRGPRRLPDQYPLLSIYTSGKNSGAEVVSAGQIQLQEGCAEDIDSAGDN